MAPKPLDHSSKPSAKRKKLQRLPPNAKVHKRPLLHPAIPSAYANAEKQKVIYVSSSSPFISVVKRTDKLLRLADKRLVQSATTFVQQQNHGKRKRTSKVGGGKVGGDDEILAIAEVVEDAKKNGRRGQEGVKDAGGEEVVLKGTGKAIQKVAQLGLWFQQRDEYVVKLRTESVKAIDDIAVDDEGEEQAGEGDAQPGPEREEDDEEAMDLDASIEGDAQTAVVKQRPPSNRKAKLKDSATGGAFPKTRIRYTSVLEVAVSLR